MVARLDCVAPASSGSRAFRGSRIGLCTLALGAPLLAGGAQQQLVLVRSLEREPQELVLDPTRIAVFDSGGHAEPGSLLASAGAGVAKLEAWPIPKWSLLELSSSNATRAELQARLDALAAGGFFASPVFFGDDGGPLWFTPELLVRARDGAAMTSVELALANAGCEIAARDFGALSGAYRVRTGLHDGFAVLALANSLAQRPEFEIAEPDAVFTGRVCHVPNDPGFTNCWGLHNTGQFGGTPDEDVDAPEAWDITFGKSSVIVTVMDVGVEQGHPDLQQIAGKDFTGQNSVGGGPFNSCDNHATALAGVISATIDNGLGTVGVAPGCRVASARIFISTNACDGSWSSQASWTVDALAWAESIGARVTLNGGVYGFVSAIVDAKYLSSEQNGLVHFAPAGNTFGPPVGYPAKLPSVNAVTATTEFGGLAGFSSFGNALDFSAPGFDIYTTDRTGSAGWYAIDYGFAQGTSFAAAFSAGVAALAISLDPTLTPNGVEKVLQETCVDAGPPGFDTQNGWGLINADNLVRTLPSSYCTAKTNSQGCTPAVGFSGQFSLSIAGPFQVTATSVLNNKNGILFYGYTPASAPYQGGFLCVQPPVHRTPVQNSAGNLPPDDCSGAYQFDLKALAQSGTDPALAVGVDVFAQYWSRDPLSSVPTGLSDALRLRLRP